MTAEELVHEVADTLRQSPELAGIPVIEDNVGDHGNELEKAVSKTRISALVGWTSFQPTKQDASVIIGDVALNVSLFETPSVNRSKGAPGIREIATAVAKTLVYCQTDDMVCPIFLKEIKPPEILDAKRGIIYTDVIFTTKVEL